MARTVRLVTSVGLGALAFVILPTTAGFVALVPGTLVARSAAAACVAGLVSAPLRSRGLAPIAAVGACTCGFLIIIQADSAYADLAALAAGLGAAALLGLGLEALAFAHQRIAATVALAIVLLVAAWYAGFMPGPLRGAPAQVREAGLRVTLQPEKYGFDGDDYLRTYSLMKSGIGYYDAFAKSQAEDARHDADFLTSPFNYREPLIFLIWRFLPGSSAHAVFLWFVALGLATLAAAYRVAAKLTEAGCALLAPIALTSYFSFFWWAGTWFTMAELWASCFAIGAIAALLSQRRVASLALLVAAVATREFMLLLVPAWLCAWILWEPRSSTRSWWFPITAVLVPTAVLAAHFVAVPPLAPGGAGLEAWLHGGPERLTDALRFGWRPAAAAGVLPLVFTAAAVASAACARPVWRAAALSCATVLPVLFLLSFSAGAWGAYWGAFYIPLALAIAPGALAPLLPPSADGRRAGAWSPLDSLHAPPQSPASACSRSATRSPASSMPTE